MDDLTTLTTENIRELDAIEEFETTDTAHDE
jgi:hypothetical protein